MKLRINDIEVKTTDLSKMQEPGNTGSMDEVFLKQLNEVVENNLGNEHFTVEELADSLAYSRSQLHRKIHKLTNQSVSQYIRNIRLQYGMSFLEDNIGTVSEIAYKVGFNSSTYFIKCFSERYGISPGEIRRKVDSKEKIAAPKDEKTAFEALHPGTSEGLIRELYEHLILFKPELENYLFEDKTNESTIDIRVLAFQIIRSYPWPIAVELRRLFSGAMKEVNYKRLVQLKRAIQRILDFFTYLLLSELIEELNRNDLKSDLKEACKRCLEEINLSNQCLLFKNAHSLISNDVIIRFIKELDILFDESFFRELDEWVEIHSSLDDLLIQESCSTLEQSLIFFIKKAAFLSRYQLINVSSIKVNKLKYRSPLFKHQLHILNSIDTDFKIQEEELEQYSDSNAVLLVKKANEPNQFLNLSPFVIDTHSESTKDMRKRVKRDIFLFKKFDGEKLHYSGSEVLTPTDLSEMENYPLLLDEYEDAMNIITQ